MKRMRFMAAALAALTVLSAPAVAAPAPKTQCRSLPAGADFAVGAGTRIHVRTIGSGTPILFIPSLARGVADFDLLAGKLADAGYMSILPDVRGTGQTIAPPPATLFDLAQDAKAVIDRLCDGPVDVVGHAFGNRVARALATASPGSVRAVALLAGGGKAAPTPEIAAALRDSVAEGRLPDDRRLKALQLAFFAAGHDPHAWLSGWYSQAEDYQNAAMKRSPVEGWWKAGSAPVLLVQAAEDPIAPAGNATALGTDIGERLTLVTLRRTSHAILPEQPDAVAWILASYFAGSRDANTLQTESDARIRP